MVAADEAAIVEAAQAFRGQGAEVVEIQADLSTMDGVEKLYSAIGGRPVDALAANAGRGLGKGFLDQDLAEAQKVVDTNISGTIHLLHLIGAICASADGGVS